MSSDKMTPLDEKKDLGIEHAEYAEHHTPASSTAAGDLALAQQANADEHNMTVREAIRRYPKAIMWSVLVSSAIVMEGYDIVLVGSFMAQPAFSRKYGEYVAASDSYQVSASWQAGVGNAATIGTIIGAFANGYFTHKYGYRRVLLASLTSIVAFIFVSFFSPNLAVLTVGQLLCGVPWGVFSTIAPAYASEVAPMRLRGILTVYVNLCWAFGQLISAGVQSGFSGNTTQWAYRIPFAIQWAWPIPLFAVLYFAPESPWWLVRTGQLDKAEESVRRLGSGADRDNAKATVAMMCHTNELEKDIDAGTSYLDCFKGIDLRRTEVACMAFAAQPFCGSAMGGSPSYFLVQAGLPTSVSFKLSVGGLGLASVGTIISWKLLHSFGRRTLYLVGLGALTAILFAVGIISAAAPGTAEGPLYAQASLMLLWLLVYYLTVGPICYAIISEVSSTRLRNKSVCLSRIAYYVAQIVTNVINPYLLNPTAGDWKGKTGFFWGGWSLAFFVWTYFRCPELKDRTYEELDILFANKVSARKFKSTKVDPYAANGGVISEQ